MTVITPARAATVWSVDPPSFESGEALLRGSDSPDEPGVALLDGGTRALCSTLEGCGPAIADVMKKASVATASTNARTTDLCLTPSRFTNAFLARTTRLRRA
jgi:hypothetical protein